MPTKTSVKGAARAAARDDAKARKQALQVHQGTALSGTTLDSFVNFAQKLGVGADNALSGGTYAYNPMTRNRQLLEWIHRGSWLGGQVIDVVADDMTRAGVEFETEMDPSDSQAIQSTMTDLGVWDKINECVKWGRLYGGAIAVPLIDGQDPKTPLRPETIGRDQFKGVAVLDRWMLEPSLEDLVTEYGPALGLPKYYRVMPNAPVLRGAAIHYSRVLVRHLGAEMPYQQALTENLWGASVLERLYDRMLAFDSASTGAAQLVHKAYLRTLKVKDMRAVVAAGGQALNGLVKYAEQMRRYQGIEGITMIDAEDEFEVQQSTAMSGIADVIDKLAEQISGATQIPLARLFGQAPGGLNSDGDSHLQTYYEGIAQKQQKSLHGGVYLLCALSAQSNGIKLPDDFGVKFRALKQLDDTQKATVAKTIGEAVQAAKDGGIIGTQTSLKELRQSSRTTGIFTNITQEQIDQADDELPPPGGEEALGAQDKEHDLATQGAQHEHEAGLAEADRDHDAEQAELDRQHDLEKTQLQQKHDLAKTKLTQQHAAKQQQAGDKTKLTIADKTAKARVKLKEQGNGGKAKPVASRPRG